MKSIPLTNTGEMLIPSEESELTDDSELRDGMGLGRHDWKGCAGGEFQIYEVISGWTLTCMGCGMQRQIPREVKTVGELRAYAEEFFKE